MKTRFGSLKLKEKIVKQPVRACLKASRAVPDQGGFKAPVRFKPPGAKAVHLFAQTVFGEGETAFLESVWKQVPCF